MGESGGKAPPRFGSGIASISQFVYLGMHPTEMLIGACNSLRMTSILACEHLPSHEQSLMENCTDSQVNRWTYQGLKSFVMSESVHYWVCVVSPLFTTIKANQWVLFNTVGKAYNEKACNKEPF